MNYNHINLTYSCFSNTFDNVGKVIQSKPVFQYENGISTGNIIGQKYTVILDKNHFNALDIKVEEKEPTITNEDIENSEDGFVLVKINGFSAKFYQNPKDGSIKIMAKAESIEVIDK